MKVKIEFEQFPPSDDRQFVINGVDNHNIGVTGHSAYYQVNFFIRNERREVMGGLFGQIWGKWLHIAYLWVAEPLRHRGLATRMLKQAEDMARERECIGIALETFSFQARPLYEKNGFRLVGQVDDYPPGHTWFFMSKRLDARKRGRKNF